MNWILNWLVGRLTTRDKIELAYRIVRDESVVNADAERFITEICKDANNKVISFKVRD